MAFNVIANIVARHPASIAITLGGIGMMLGFAYSGMIFWTGVGLQILWLYFTGI